MDERRGYQPGFLVAEESSKMEKSDMVVQYTSQSHIVETQVGVGTIFLKVWDEMNT